jgi:hypothetical protein
MMGGQQQRATMARGGSSPKGAVSSGGVPPAAGRGQEARGRSGVHAVLAKEEERGEKGAGGVSGALLKGSGGKQGKEGGLGSVSAWRREKEGEGGLARRRAARDGQQRPEADMQGVVACGRTKTGEAGNTDRWAWGHSNGRRGQNGLNRFKIQTV